jgi:hypothetical protein
MDPRQFDALSRTLAQGASRRQTLTRVGAAGLLAGLAAALGRGRSEALPAVQGETCRLDIVATVRLGPNATERMQTDTPGELRGELDFTLDPDGAIDAGSLRLDDGPQLPVVGQATGRAINLRADFSPVREGLTLVLVGTAQEPLRRCQGAVDGLLTGPAIGDLGDWHATATAAGGGRSAPVAPTPTPVAATAQACAAGLTRCGSACVSLQNDIRHCSACRLVCSEGAACIDGRCVCPPNRATSCNGVCVDLGSDMLNCGRCSNGCGGGDAPYICQAGQCVLVDGGGCDLGLIDCGGGICADLSSDPANCGGCGVVCPPDPGGATVSCAGGECLYSVTGPMACLPGLTDCGGVCVDLSSDPFACGACGVVCSPQAPACIGGACTL